VTEKAQGVQQLNTDRVQRQALEQLLATKEELDPELEMWVDLDGPLGPSIKHPLVFSIVHHPNLNALVNEQFRIKKEALAEAIAKGQWHRAVFLYERPYRVEAFADICWKLDAAEYWDLLREVWTDTENAWQHYDQWRELLSADVENREMMSSQDVRCVFTLPPERGGLAPRTRIYRGFSHDEGLDGFSWTLDQARAKWFARRAADLTGGGHPARVAAGWVAREHVIAHITDRDEQEIVVLPEHVEDKTVEEV